MFNYEIILRDPRRKIENMCGTHFRGVRNLDVDLRTINDFLNR